MQKKILQLDASCTPPTGDLARKPGMFPDWESNWQPFGLQAGTQCTEPYEPGQYTHTFYHSVFLRSKLKIREDSNLQDSKLQIKYN